MDCQNGINKAPKGIAKTKLRNISRRNNSSSEFFKKNLPKLLMTDPKLLMAEIGIVNRKAIKKII
jgi:hypothetical protein